jgi:hypothetical protein
MGEIGLVLSILWTSIHVSLCDPMSLFSVSLSRSQLSLPQQSPTAEARKEIRGAERKITAKNTTRSNTRNTHNQVTHITD